jgi:hypothetical protein
MFRTVRPHADILAAFSHVANNAVRQMAVNDGEGQNLSDLRDSLLPILLSGLAGRP